MINLGQLIGVLKYNESIRVYGDISNQNQLYQGKAIMCYDYLKECTVEIVETNHNLEELHVNIHYNKEELL